MFPILVQETIKLTKSKKDIFTVLENLSFDDFISKIANGLVSFGFKLFIAILVFYVGKFIISKLYKLTYKIMTNKRVDLSLTTFILSLVRILLYFILIVTVIGILGIETSSFLALFASAGIAVGMALSGTLQNFAGGVLILLLKPYKVGDFIEAQGYTGTVKSIQIFNTIINTVDNKAIIIPNGGLSTGTINNYSLEKYRRVDWNVSLAYGTDFEAAKKVILEMLTTDDRIIGNRTDLEIDCNDEKNADDPVCIEEKEKENILQMPIHQDHSSFVGLNEMGDSSINIVVRAWTRFEDYWPLYFDMNERLYKELPEKGFSFPFPQLDVHLDK